MAPNAAAAAQYYPAIYWYSMLKIPDESEFSGTGTDGNEHAGDMKSQARMARQHQDHRLHRLSPLGTHGTRTIPDELGHFETRQKPGSGASSPGRPMTNMVNAINRARPAARIAVFRRLDRPDRQGRTAVCASPSGRRASSATSCSPCGTGAGPRPTCTTRSRPTGAIPRSTPTASSTARPRTSTDYCRCSIRRTTPSSEIKHPVRDPKTPSSKTAPMAPSPYWGAEPIWDSQTSTHNPMMDEKGRVWFTARVRPPANPDFCKQGSTIRRRKLFPLQEASRHLSMYDPTTDKFTLISTCFPTHHLIFAEDANNTLWTSAGGRKPVVGWLNRKMFDETGDEQKSQGWTPFILDTNGNGKRDDYVEPNQPVDPTKDKRVVAGLYSVSVEPDRRHDLGHLARLSRATSCASIPGPIRPHTALTEIYEPPLPGYGPRGGDIDRNGVVLGVAGERPPGELRPQASARSLNGPTATGKHCPEGWTLYPFPGPQFKDIKRSGQRRGELLHLGRPVRHARPRQERADRHRQHQRRVAGAGRRQVRDPARALSDRLFHQGHGRPHRRPERRLEGQGIVDDLLRTRTMFHLETGKGTAQRS